MGKAELTLQIDATLLEQARAAQLRLDLLVERALKAALGPQAAAERAQQWEKDSAETITSHNRYVAEHGAFGKGWRNW